MNEIKVITELCAEDRTRLDRVVAALEELSKKIITQETANAVLTKALNIEPAETTEQPEIEAEKPIETDTLATVPPEVEQPTVDEKPVQNEAPAPAVTVADLQQKIVSLSAAGKKAQVREIVIAYASKVSDIPADKRAEVFEKLTALEG